MLGKPDNEQIGFSALSLVSFLCCGVIITFPPCRAECLTKEPKGRGVYAGPGSGQIVRHPGQSIAVEAARPMQLAAEHFTWC